MNERIPQHIRQGLPYIEVVQYVAFHEIHSLLVDT
jgi:hypothetical protein